MSKAVDEVVAQIGVIIRSTNVSDMPEDGLDQIANAVRHELDVIDGPDGSRGTAATEVVEYLIAALQLSLGRIPDGSDEADLTCVDCGHEVDEPDELDEDGRCRNCQERVMEEELEEEENEGA